MNTRVESYLCRDITRASSITTATPEASSLAPGASLVASLASVARES